jgi:hypothetical protein
MKTKFFLFLLLVAATQMKANNMLVKNVTTTGDNATNKTIQVQFDMSWDNSWRDGINWDAAWVFMKFKDANGLWQHVQLNTTGFANGTGTANTIQVGSDKVGAFVYRSAAGTGTFGATTMQLQWNYGLSGLTSVTGLEVRVFAVEMVYVPEGDFNVAGARREGPGAASLQSSSFYVWNQGSGRLSNTFLNAPGNNFPVINQRLSPVLSYNDGTSTTLRIKGNAGIDTNNDGLVDNVSYPTGYSSFYVYKYELSEQQYADFLNTLSSSQITTLGVAGSNITISNGQYFSSTPNKACGNSNSQRLLAYADWSGIRPITILEFNKASYGPYQPIHTNYGYPAGGSSQGVNNNGSLIDVGYFASGSSDRSTSGATYYGALDFTGNAKEPVVKLNYFNFTSTNGDGVLSASGISNVPGWSPSNMIIYIDQTAFDGFCFNCFTISFMGFRYVRSAE